MGEGLGKIPQKLAGEGIDLLGIQADVVGVAEHPAEYAVGSLPLADHRQRLSQPEGADGECTFFPLQPVGMAVAKDELSIRARQLASNGPDGGMDPWVVPG